MPAMLRRIRARPWLTVALVIAVLAAGGGFWWFLQRSATTPAAAAPAATRTVAASIGNMKSTVTTSGSVTPAVQESVTFGASGRVDSVRVSQGQSVKKGQVLATVDPIALRAALASAKATLASAEAKVTAAHTAVTTAQLDLTAAETAVTTAQTAVATAAATSSATDDTTAAGGVITAKTDVTNDKAILSQDQAQVVADQAQSATAKEGITSAHTSLQAATLISPIDGLVATVGIRVGDSVSGTAGSSTSTGSGVGAGSTGGGTNSGGGGGGASAGSGTSASGGSGGGTSGSGGGSSSSSSSAAAFLIVSTASWVANVTVDDSSVNLIKQGIQAQLIVGSSATPIFGMVSSVGLISTSTGSTASYPVVVTITGSPPGLHDGAAATVDLIYRQLTNVLTVPTVAIHTGAAGKSINRILNGKAVPGAITTGFAADGVTQILSGLAEGDEVQVPVTAGARTGAGRTGTGGAAGSGGAGGYGGAGGFGAAGGLPGGGGAAGAGGRANNRNSTGG